MRLPSERTNEQKVASSKQGYNHPAEMDREQLASIRLWVSLKVWFLSIFALQI